MTRRRPGAAACCSRSSSPRAEGAALRAPLVAAASRHDGGGVSCRGQVHGDGYRAALRVGGSRSTRRVCSFTTRAAGSGPRARRW
eukprot:scaffold34116_cov108-Phaeocystis_antarctica.AAC.1